MPINPSDLLFGQITEEEIKEFTAFSGSDSRSPRVDTFRIGEVDLTMPFRIPADKLKAALQWILGVDYVDNNNNLRRSTPMFHPVHCWAWAESVQVRGISPDGDDINAVIWEFQVTPSKWLTYEVDVTFGMPKYRVLADDEISVNEEFTRYVSKELTPDAQIVSIENGQVMYAAGINPWNLQPHNATIPVARRDGAGVVITWHRVPQEYVQAAPTGFDVDDGLPEKFIQACGKVNSATFFGKPAETMLLTHVTMDKYVSPLITDSIANLYFLYDVHFHFMYVKQLDDDIGLGGSESRRGHNLLLGPNMKYWYAQNATSSKPIFLPVDLRKLFTHHTDTF